MQKKPQVPIARTCPYASNCESTSGGSGELGGVHAFDGYAHIIDRGVALQDAVALKVWGRAASLFFFI